MSSFSTLSGSARLSTAKSEAKAASKLPPKPKSAVKYDAAKSVVNTGSSVNKLKEKEASKNFVVGKNEIFKRIRTKRLAEYIEAEGGWEAEVPPPPPNEELRPPPTAADVLNPRDDGPKPEPPRRRPDYSYLLLDLRDKEDFDKCRIRGALHYPVFMLSRSTNEFLPEMYSYKNKENKLIVVYDLDESIAQKAATTLIQKGIDNIYLLSGGLFDMHEKFPEHVIGALPPKPGTAKLTGSGKLSSSTGSTRPSSTTSNASTFSSASSVSRASTISKTSTAASKASPSAVRTGAASTVRK